ncbi:MAG: hypothetical protein ABW360_11220 [Phenylobacterium sp.]
MWRTAAFLHETQGVGFLVGDAPDHDSSPLDQLIATAIVQANIEPLMRDSARSRAYAALETAPPDDLRRPVSIRSISNSLRLSHETTRRRIARMAERGQVVITREGVIVPSAVLASPFYVEKALRAADQLRDLYFHLLRIGALPPRGANAPAPAEPLPYRALIRRFGPYFLRLMEGMTGIVGDLLPVIVLMGLLEEAVATARPVSLARLAEAVSLPKETVRRNAAVLIAAGYCRRTKDGLEAPGDLFGQPVWAAFCEANLTNLRRLYADLDAMGVVAHWTGR